MRMAVSSSKGSGTDVEIEEEVEKKNSDLIDALKASGHFTCEYSNGLVSGVRLESIPGARGVHVEVVHVLDLRTARFGKSGLAMRAALLESVNRDFETVLHDVGLGDSLERRNLKTPFRTVSLLLIRGSKGKGVSLVHPTRAIYVVTRNVKPKMDMSWLTDSGRIVTVEEFALARRSDAHSFLPELKHAVSHKKWSLLKRSIRRGWLGVLAMAASLISLVSTALILLGESGSTLPSVLTVIVSLLSGLWLLSSSKDNLRGFENMTRNENATLTTLGDSTRIHQSIDSNEENLRLLGDISFVISPLMATLANAIESGDLNESMNTACSILDECIRLAPFEPQTRNSPRPEDEGLARFLGLFDSLGVDVEEEALALSYVALTAHITSPLNFEEMMQHIGRLNFALYNAGAIRPDIKDIVEDRINNRDTKRTSDTFDKNLRSDPEEFSKDVPHDSSVIENGDPLVASDSEELDQDLLDEMRNSSIDDIGTKKPVIDEFPVIAAETVNESTHEEETPTDANIVTTSNANKDSVEFVQAILFDSEEGSSSGS
jgi:hypothetical protein